jgi:hypothetical protein
VTRARGSFAGVHESKTVFEEGLLVGARSIRRTLGGRRTPEDEIVDFALSVSSGDE